VVGGSEGRKKEKQKFDDSKEEEEVRNCKVNDEWKIVFTKCLSDNTRMPLSRPTHECRQHYHSNVE
jgi:hypothetical protein